MEEIVIFKNALLINPTRINLVGEYFIGKIEIDACEAIISNKTMAQLIIHSTHPQLTDILDRLKEELQRRYGDRLLEVRLFGSQARGEAGEESDIDVLVILKDEEVDAIREQNRILDFRYDLELKFHTLIQVLFVSEKTYLESDYHFFKVLRSESVGI